ncbi:Modification methylase Eco57IB [Clostridium felsineum]|nr:Modification methylase Eco57IB [Clostridium felsineum]
MLLRKDATEERLTGRYFTPKDLASYIIDWVIQDNNINKILEPSCGNGVFLECLGERRIEEGCNITAIEIDEDVSFEASRQIDNSIRFNNCYDYQRALTNSRDMVNNGTMIINDDFYKVYEQELKSQRFQAIVGNPPYIRYQYLSQQQREEQSNILIRNNMRSNKLINAWVSFVVACAEILDDNGKMGFVIPAELLQVAYAEDLRRFIMRTFQRITIVTFRELVFPNVQQEVVLLLVEKEILHTREHQLRIVQYQDINELIDSSNLDEYPFNDVEINESKLITNCSAKNNSYISPNILG